VPTKACEFRATSNSPVASGRLGEWSSCFLCVCLSTFEHLAAALRYTYSIQQMSGLCAGSVTSSLQAWPFCANERRPTQSDRAEVLYLVHPKPVISNSPTPHPSDTQQHPAQPHPELATNRHLAEREIDRQTERESERERVGLAHDSLSLPHHNRCMREPSSGLLPNLTSRSRAARACIHPVH